MPGHLSNGEVALCEDKYVIRVRTAMIHLDQLCVCMWLVVDNWNGPW